MQPFDIPFTDGTVEAYDANGPEFPWAPGVQALLGLRDLTGTIAQTRRRLSRFIQLEDSWRLEIRGALACQWPAASHHSTAGEQRQVHQGVFRLSWTRHVRVFWFRRRIARGATDIFARVTLTYPPQPDAPIAGTIDGTLLASVLPRADPHVAGSLSSAIPVQYAEPSTWALNKLVLSGNWDR